MATFETIGLRATLDGLTPYLFGAQRFNQATESMGRSTDKAAGLSSKLTGALKALAVGAGVAGAAIGAVSLKSAAGFEKSLAQIDALTNTSAEDTAKLGKEILNLSKRVPKSPQELGAAAYFALSSGINDVSEALKVVETSAKASSAGLGDTRQIVDVVTSVLNAYGKENISAARATDILVATVREGKGEAADFASVIGGVIPIAAALKVPFEEVGTLLAVITNGGDNAAEATTKLRGILNQLASPSDAAKKALGETGRFAGTMSEEFVKATATANDVKLAQIAVAEANKRFADSLSKSGENSLESQKALAELRDAQARLATVTENSKDRILKSTDAFGQLRKEIGQRGLLPVLFKLRNAFEGNLEGLAEIFPDVRGFIGFLSAIESQGNATTQVMKRIQASAGITDEAFERMSKTLNFQVDLLKNQVNIGLIQLGSIILPLVTRAVTGLLKQITLLTPRFERLGKLFLSGFKGGSIGGAFDDMSQAAFDAGRRIRHLLDVLKETAEIVGRDLLNAFRDLAPFIAEAARFFDRLSGRQGSLGETANQAQTLARVLEFLIGLKVALFFKDLATSVFITAKSMADFTLTVLKFPFRTVQAIRAGYDAVQLAILRARLAAIDLGDTVRGIGSRTITLTQNVVGGAGQVAGDVIQTITQVVIRSAEATKALTEDIADRTQKITQQITKIETTKVDPKSIGLKLGQSLGAGITQGIGIVIGVALAPVIAAAGSGAAIAAAVVIGTALVGGLIFVFRKQIVEGLTTVFNNLPEIIGTVIGATAGALAVLLLAPIALAGALVKKALIPLGEAIVSGLSEIVIPAIGSIFSQLPSLALSFFAQLPDLAFQVMLRLPALMTQLPGLIVTALSDLPNQLSIAFDVIPRIFGDVVAALPELASEAVTAVGKFISGLAADLGVNLEPAVKATGKIFERIGEQAAKTFTAIVDGFNEAIGVNIPAEFLKLAPVLENIGKGIVAAIVAGIRAALNLIREAPSLVVNAFKDGFTGFASLLQDIGRSLVQGVWKGIEGAKDWFFRNIKGFFKDALDSALAAIGAGSPARTWIPVGEAIMEGVGVGIDRKKAEIEKKLRELQPSNTDGGSGGGGGRSTPSTFNIPSPGVGGIPIDRSLPPRPQPTGYTVPPGYYWDGYTFVRIPGLPPTAYYQQGTSYVPRDMWAFIHAGEAVLNRRQANDWRMVPQRSQEILARMGPQYNQSFGGPTFSPMFNVSGATLEQQESAAISAVRRFFGDLRYRSLNSGAFLSPAVG